MALKNGVKHKRSNIMMICLIILISYAKILFSIGRLMKSVQDTAVAYAASIQFTIVLKKMPLKSWGFWSHKAPTRLCKQVFYGWYNIYKFKCANARRLYDKYHEQVNDYGRDPAHEIKNKRAEDAAREQIWSVLHWSLSLDAIFGDIKITRQTISSRSACFKRCVFIEANTRDKQGRVNGFRQ